MPRPKLIADGPLLDVALAVLRRDGPAGVSFAAVAGEAGLAASTVVQRFGSKAGLLEAALLRAWDLLDAATAVAVAEAGPDHRGVVDLLVRLTPDLDVDGFADDLLVLREDLRNPVLRHRGAAWLGTLAEAVDRRVGDGAAGIGALVVAHWQGLVTVWGFTRDAPLPVEVRRSLESLLARLLDGPPVSNRRLRRL